VAAKRKTAKINFRAVQSLFLSPTPAHSQPTTTLYIIAPEAALKCKWDVGVSEGKERRNHPLTMRSCRCDYRRFGDENGEKR
jgi:hypothetical protein